jgi:hypothetical protein
MAAPRVPVNRGRSSPLRPGPWSRTAAPLRLSCRATATSMGASTAWWVQTIFARPRWWSPSQWPGALRSISMATRSQMTPTVSPSSSAIFGRTMPRSMPLSGGSSLPKSSSVPWSQVPWRRRAGTCSRQSVEYCSTGIALRPTLSSRLFSQQMMVDMRWRSMSKACACSASMAIT